jgi:hypothetical protein
VKKKGEIAKIAIGENLELYLYTTAGSRKLSRVLTKHTAKYGSGTRYFVKNTVP